MTALGSADRPRVSVITGGGGGIGAACARELAPRGLVLVADLSLERAESVCATLRSEGIQARSVACDVADPEAVAALAAAARSAGRLGAVVHSAGVAPPGTMDVDRILNVNILGSRNVMDAFEPLAEAGTVAVCIASLAGHRVLPHGLTDDELAHATDMGRLRADAEIGNNALAAYSLSKRSIITMCEARARDWGRAGARLLSVSPGLVLDTEIGFGASTISAERYAEFSAVGRAGMAVDIAAVVGFLTSPAASYISATDILVDGGVLADVNHHQPADASRKWHAAQ